MEVIMENFFPEILITYLWCFRQAFSATGFPYFQGFIAAQLLSGSRKTVTQIATVCFFIDKSLSSWERFLSQAQWSMPLVIEPLIVLVVKELGSGLLYAGSYLLAVDTTSVAKVMGRLLGVQKWSERRSPTDKGETVIGHHWAICGLLSRFGNLWRCFPLMTKLISGQQHPFEFVVTSQGEVHPIRFWESILSMIRQVSQSLDPSRLIVVADAYFSKAAFLNPLMQAGISVVTRLRKDAVGWEDPHYNGRGRPPKRGKQWKLAHLIHHFPLCSVGVTLYGHTHTVSYVTRELWLRDLKQKVKVVIIATKSHPILLVSTQCALTPQQIIEIYGARFALELTIRDLKQHLGLGDYQLTTPIAFLRFAQLCCCAATLGRLILCRSQVLPFFDASPADKTELVEGSLTRLRRSLFRFVITRFLSQKSAPDADVEKNRPELEAMVRLAA